jgi:hypothetical protein
MYSPFASLRFFFVLSFNLCHILARSCDCDKRLLVSSCLSVRPHGTTRLLRHEFSWKLIFEYFWKMCRDSSSSIKIWQQITGTLHEHLCTFMIISRLILLRMKNVSGKNCRENQNTLFLFHKIFPENCALYEIMRKNNRARQTTDDNITWRMRFACWITKVPDTHSEYVIRTAFPRQQWLRERAPVFLCTYIACPFLDFPFCNALNTILTLPEGQRHFAWYLL